MMSSEGQDDGTRGASAAATVYLNEPPADVKRDGAHVVKGGVEEPASGPDAAAPGGDDLQDQGQTDKTDIPTKTDGGDGGNNEGEIPAAPTDNDAAVVAEEEHAETKNNNKQTNEENNMQEKQMVSSTYGIIGKVPSPTASAVSTNSLQPPSDPPSVLHVTLPLESIEEEEEEEEAGPTTKQQLPAAAIAQQKDLASSNPIAAAEFAAPPPKIGGEDTIATFRNPPAIPLATTQHAKKVPCSSNDNDGEEKKMDDGDLEYVEQPTVMPVCQHGPPPKTPGAKATAATPSKVEPSPLGSSSVSTPRSDTTKAKSMPTPSTTASGGRGKDGRTLEEMMTTGDMANASMEQKVDGLKLLLNIIKNLSDPELSTDPSHHMIPWDCQEDSISGILRSCPFVREYLTERIGFAPLTKGGERFLCLFDSDDEGSYAGVEEDVLQRAMLEVNCALARLEHDEQEEKTMPDDKKEDESSDQNIPSTSAAASANQEVAYGLMGLASGPNASMRDITNGNVAAKLVQVDSSDDNAANVAKNAGVSVSTTTGNSSPPVSMQDAKATLCGSPTISTDAETEEEDVPDTAMVVEDGNKGKKEFFHHTATIIDAYVERLTKPGRRIRNSHCAHFDTVSIGGRTTLGAWVLFNTGQLIVPDGTDGGFGSKGIPHKDIDIHAFRNDNANFIEGGGELKADDDCFELGICIQFKDGAIHCAFDGCDPDRVVYNDGRSARETLCQFAQSFVRIHDLWLKKNPGQVDEMCSQKQNECSAQIDRSSSPSAKNQPSGTINLVSYRPNSKREEVLNEFVSYVSESAPSLVPTALAWAEGSCSTDDMICTFAGILLRCQRDIDRFNELLLEGAKGYSVESRYGALHRNGDPLFFYRSPDGIQTTDRKTRQFLGQFNESQSRDEQCIVLEEYLRPLPEDYRWMKESNMVSLVLGLAECKEFDLAIRLLEGTEAVIAEQDAPSEDVFAPLYNLRGQVCLQQAKEMIAQSKDNPFDQFRCGIDHLFEDNAIAGECYQIQQILSNASEWLTTAKTTIEGMMTDPIPEFGAQDDCELALLQDLCTLTMRIGKTYELQGDVSNAIETYEEALSLLHTVRPASSSRIAAAHLDLGDLCAKTLIPDPSGNWAGDTDNMARAVGHYLSSARSIAVFVARESRRVDPDFFIAPGANTMSQVREVLHEQNAWGDQINIGTWACREINDMVETLRNSDALRYGKSWFHPINMAVNLVRERLKEMAHHPMHREGLSGRAKVKQECEEALVGPLPFTINEGDSHKEDRRSSFENEERYYDGRASKISKMKRYGDITWAGAKEKDVGASFYDDHGDNN